MVVTPSAMQDTRGGGRAHGDFPSVPNNTTAFQAALDVCAGSGIAALTGGTYHSGPLTIPG